jgi:hypothetical protein
MSEMVTKLETVESLMNLMTKHRVNKVKLDGIELEVTSFPPAPPTEAEIQAVERIAKAHQEANKADFVETLFHSARPM